MYIRTIVDLVQYSISMFKLVREGKEERKTIARMRVYVDMNYFSLLIYVDLLLCHMHVIHQIIKTDEAVV